MRRTYTLFFVSASIVSADPDIFHPCLSRGAFTPSAESSVPTSQDAHSDAQPSTPWEGGDYCPLVCPRRPYRSAERSFRVSQTSSQLERMERVPNSACVGRTDPAGRSHSRCLSVRGLYPSRESLLYRPCGTLIQPHRYALLERMGPVHGVKAPGQPTPTIRR